MNRVWGPSDPTSGKASYECKVCKRNQTTGTDYLPVHTRKVNGKRVQCDGSDTPVSQHKRK